MKHFSQTRSTNKFRFFPRDHKYWFWNLIDVSVPWAPVATDCFLWLVISHGQILQLTALYGDILNFHMWFITINYFTFYDLNFGPKVMNFDHNFFSISLINSLIHYSHLYNTTSRLLLVRSGPNSGLSKKYSFVARIEWTLWSQMSIPDKSSLSTLGSYASVPVLV